MQEAPCPGAAARGRGAAPQGTQQTGQLSGQAVGGQGPKGSGDIAGAAEPAEVCQDPPAATAHCPQLPMQAGHGCPKNVMGIPGRPVGHPDLPPMKEPGTAPAPEEEDSATLAAHAAPLGIEPRQGTRLTQATCFPQVQAHVAAQPCAQPLGQGTHQPQVLL